MSKFDDIVDDVIALLEVVPAVASGNIFAEKPRLIAESIDLSVVVRIRSSAPERGPMGAVTWSSTLAIDINSRGDRPAKLASATVLAIYNRIMDDPTLAGTVIDCEPGPIDWDFDNADTDLCAMTLLWNVQHRTTETLT